MCHAILNFHWKTILVAIKTKYLIIGKRKHIFLFVLDREANILSIFLPPFFYLDCMDLKMYPQSKIQQFEIE